MDRIALFGESKTDIRIRPARPFGNMATSPMSRSLRILAACAVLAGLAACAAPPPRRPLPPLWPRRRRSRSAPRRSSRTIC